MGSPDLQFSLDLFEPEIGRTLITECPKEVGFRRANVLFDVKGLSLSGRRMLNAMWFLASHQPTLEMYDIDYTYFKWLAKISSRDQRWMSDLITEAQGAGILVLDPDHAKANNEGFIRVPLLGPAGVKDGRIYFELYRSVRRQLANPEQYAFYSLRLSNRLDSLFSAILYDKCLKDSFRGATDWVTIDEFLAWFGKETAKVYVNEGYRAINRYILKTSIPEISEKTNLTLRVETKNQGRKVLAIRFLIQKKEQFRHPEEITEQSRKVFEILRNEFGLSNKNVDEITANADDWSETRLLEAIELVRLRIKTTEVRSPGGLFMHILKQDIKLTDTERERENRRLLEDQTRTERAKLDAQAKDAAVNKVVEQSNDALARFGALAEPDQRELLADFTNSPQFGLARRFLPKGAQVEITAELLLGDAKLRGLFSTFLEQALKAKTA